VAAQTPAEIEALISKLEWRSVGPADMGGRTVDIAALPGDPSTVYMATASGGLWKTTDRGTTWSSIFESGGTLSLGAVALAPSDPNVLYLGTGENNPRNSASIGDGVYRSTDAGRTWTHTGLESTERVGRIRVHPTDPDRVYVAALGHAWGDNPDRGVYRSTDGGATWERVLHVDEGTGAADLALHPTNPRILYAAMWDYRRQPWTFRSGGPGSGLYRSKDGGDTWERLDDGTGGRGLPAGELGRIGLAVSADDPDRVFAMIESEDDGVLWRSDDGGDAWRLVTDTSDINTRPFYYTDVRADPSNANRLFALSSGLWRSVDGGATWERIARNIHGDHQALWIDPEDSDRIINGNDGGFHFSFDGGDTWDFVNTVPLSQFYQIGADMREPYTVCGGLQDNDVWCGPSATRDVTGSLDGYWHEIVGPGDGMYVQIDPTDPNVIYTNRQAGNILRVDLRTREARSIDPYPVPLSGSAAAEHPYRFNWNAPIHLSPHDPETVYYGGNVLFRTRDGGQTWEEISPDLSTGDSAKLGPSGGISADNTGAEFHATIYTIAESPVEVGVIWAGTDDGHVQLTRDGGGSWTEVSDRIPGLAAGAWVSRIEASPSVPGRAYTAFDRHREDDMAPYVYRTDDYGQSWTNISGNLPTPGYVHVVREDPSNPDLVYVGTELGIWGSWSGGGDWASLRLQLPRVAVRDILVHPRDNDLIIGTHGRGIWILDDVTALQALTEVVSKPLHLFEPRAGTRYEPWARRFRFDIGSRVFVGENPPYGAILTYAVGQSVGGGEPAADGESGPKARIVILNAEGDTISRLEGEARAGFQRSAWNLRYDTLPVPDGPGGEDSFRFALTPPRALPGAYTARVELGEHRSEAPVTVRIDPRADVTHADLAAQHDALERLYRLGADAIAAVRGIDVLDHQLQSWIGRLAESEANGEIADSAGAVAARLVGVRAALARPQGGSRYQSGAPLLERLSALMNDIGRATYRPTAAQETWIGRHAEAFAQVKRRLDEEVRASVADLNRRMEAAGLGPVRDNR
jgi:photosystem II stability/assembly factor-like uncharacterized protein